MNHISSNNQLMYQYCSPQWDWFYLQQHGHRIRDPWIASPDMQKRSRSKQSDITMLFRSCVLVPYTVGKLTTNSNADIYWHNFVLFLLPKIAKLSNNDTEKSRWLRTKNINSFPSVISSTGHQFSWVSEILEITCRRTDVLRSNYQGFDWISNSEMAKNEIIILYSILN